MYSLYSSLLISYPSSLGVSERMFVFILHLVANIFKSFANICSVYYTFYYNNNPSLEK